MNREQIIRSAVVANDCKWPKQLVSGVMFYMGERITIQDFNKSLAELEGRS